MDVYLTHGPSDATEVRELTVPLEIPKLAFPKSQGLDQTSTVTTAVQFPILASFCTVSCGLYG